jgi:hypothetical protein
MSLSDGIPYLRDRILELNDGFNEVDKPFESDIPSTVIDKSFYFLIQGAYGENRSMIDFPMILQCELRLFRKGYNNESAARSYVLIDGENIMKNCMKITNANTQPSIKNVTMRTIDIESLKDNDNTIMIKILFDIRIIIDPNL